MKAAFKILLITLLLTSCGGNRTIDDSAITDVEIMISAKDFESAQSACDDMIEGKDLKQIPVRNLCQLSVFFAKLSEQQNQEDNMANATKCYRAARSLNADTTAKYFSELPMEDIQYAELLKNLANLMDSPMEIRDSEPCDSVALEALHSHKHSDDNVKEIGQKKDQSNQKLINKNEHKRLASRITGIS